MHRNHYLEVNLQNSLLALTSHLLPDSQMNSIYDLFDAKLFQQLLSIIYPTQLQFNYKAQIVQGTYLQIQVQIFMKIRQLLEQGYEKMGLSSKQWPSNKQITKMLKQSDLNILQQFLGGVFMLITFNKKVLMTITTLDECHQKQIQQFILLIRDGPSQLPTKSKTIQRQSDYNQEIENQKWIEQLQYFQNIIESKEVQLINAKNQLRNSQQEVEQLKTIIYDKNLEIETLRKKLLSFQQIDTLLLEKDSEIAQIQSKLNDSELKSRIKSSQLSKNYTDLQQKYNNLQTQHHESQNKLNKIIKQLDQTKQRQQSKDISSKTVIKNLKEKLKQLQEKSQEQQRQLLEIIEEKDKRQKQFREVLYKYEGVSLGQYDQRIDENRSPYIKNSIDNKMKSTLGDELKEITNNDHEHSSQQSVCLKQQCINLRKQHSDLIDQIVMALDLPATAACKTLTEKSHFLQKYAVKLSETMNENQKLKERIVTCSQYSNSDAEQSSKMKKKMQILKNRLKQQERKRKQQAEIMAGVIEELVKSMIPKLD